MSELPDSREFDAEARTDALDSEGYEPLFRQAMAQTRMAMCLTDPRLPDNPLVFVNESFVRLTGYQTDELIGKNCRLLQGPKTSADALERLRAGVAAEDVIVIELLNYRKDGSTFWNALHIGPIYDERGHLRYFFGSQWDVTDVHAARSEEQMARMLAREMAHRMRNMFAVIAGIVTMSARHAGVPRVAGLINERIAALGRAYDDTFSAETLEHVDLGRVARLTLGPYLELAPKRVTIRGERVMLKPATVSLVGLALHELAANAMKHGALAVEGGEIELEWAFDRDRALVIEWRESARVSPRAYASDAPAPPGGAGTGIVGDLVRAAGGELDVHWRDGVRARFTLPLERIVDPRDAYGGPR